MASPFLIATFLFFSVLYLLKLFKSDKQNLPPSPPTLPFIGNLHQLGRFHHRAFQDLIAKYGPVMLLYIGQVPTLVISSAEAVEEILKSQKDLMFSGRPQTRAGDSLLYGSTNIAFCNYGEYWRQIKKISVVELLSQKRVQEFQFVREEEVEKLVEKIRGSCRNGVPVNLSESALILSSSIVSRSALGRAFDEDDKSLEKLARKVIDLVSAFSFKDWFPPLGWMDHLTGLTATLRKTSRGLDDALEEVIAEPERRRKEEQSSEKKDMVDILLDIQKNGMLHTDLSRENLKAIILDMFVGGTDTTATAMEWAMAELFRNPNIMKKLQEEVRRVVRNKSKVTESDIHQMTYLKDVLRETLRLHAPAMLARETSSWVKLQGYDIPPKTRVLIYSQVIRRDPKVWERPEEFIPERFAAAPAEFKDDSGKLISFGCGRRICPGISFALTEAEFALANLLYWFDWRLVDGMTGEDIDMIEANSSRMKKPLMAVPTIYSP